jgi:hypothetical protein
MANSEVISLQPLTDEEFKEIKAKQEAEKHGHTGGGPAHPTPQPPPEHAEPVVWPKVEYRNIGSAAPHIDSETLPAHEHNPVIWPQVPHKAAEENTAPEFHKQAFTWPKAQKGGTDLNTESGKPSEVSQTPFVLPGEGAQKKNIGVILFQNIAILAEAEKVLYNEGCTITRITSPVDPPSGSNIALRFPWSQYETVKASLDKAGITTQGIKQL